MKKYTLTSALTQSAPKVPRKSLKASEGSRSNISPGENRKTDREATRTARRQGLA